MKYRTQIALAAAFLAIASVSPVFGQEDSALLDVLVRKGILTQKEADKLAAEAAKEVSEPQSSKALPIKIGDWVQELDLWGDVRFREYYNQLQPQLPPPPRGNRLRRASAKAASPISIAAKCGFSVSE